MVDSYIVFHGNFEPPSGNVKKSTFNESVQEELKQSLRVTTESHTQSGKRLLSGNLIYENVEKVTEIQSDYKEETTHDEFVLRSNRDGDLELVSNPELNEKETDLSIKRDYVLHANQDQFHILEDEFILLEGDQQSSSILGEFIEGSMDRATFQLRSLKGQLEANDVFFSISSAQMDNVDDKIESASISGNLKNSELYDHELQGRPKWFMMTVRYREKELSLGVSSNGGLFVYGPMNYPIEEICDFVSEYIVPTFQPQ